MGLELRRDKKHNLRSKWWYGRYMINGKRYFTNLNVEVKGTVPKNIRRQGDMAFECSRTLASSKLKELIAEAHSHKSAEKHLQELYELKAGESLTQISISDIAHVKFLPPDRRGRSAARDEAQLVVMRDFISFMKENYPAVTFVSQVNRIMAQGWLSSLEAQKNSARTYNDKMYVLKGFFERVGSDAGVIRNPFAGSLAKVKKTVHRQPFTQEELTKILNHCDAIIRPVVLTAMCTAMRRGDCCRLKWESVDFDVGFVMVKTSKTGEMAEIPLFPVLRAELEKLPRTSEYVFPEAEEMLRENIHGLTWRFQKALNAAGIKNTHIANENASQRSSLKDFHSLRTTWITMALSAGVPMELVRRVTGHSTVEVVLKHYFRPGREAFRASLGKALPKLLTGGEEEESLDLPEEILKLDKEAKSLKPEEVVKKLKALAKKVARMTKAQKAAAVLAA
jgi:integrase